MNRIPVIEQYSFFIFPHQNFFPSAVVFYINRQYPITRSKKIKRTDMVSHGIKNPIAIPIPTQNRVYPTTLRISAPYLSFSYFIYMPFFLI